MFGDGTAQGLHIGLEAQLILSDWSGVERLVATQAAAFMERGHRATIIAREPKAKTGTIPITRLPEGSGLLTVDLDTPKGLEKARADLRGADFDVIITVNARRDSLFLPWLLAGSGIPTIAAVAHPPDILAQQRWTPYEHYGLLAMADYIQVLLAPYRDQYPPALREKTFAIGNPSPPPGDVDWAARAAKEKRTLLGVGRFDDQHKNFTLLIRAWALIAKEFPDWTLTLVGDGPSWAYYHALADALPGIPITFTGAVENPDEQYAAADVFCIPSRYEGFGMVMTEAAAWGLPLVGMESCLAARELIGPEYGALAPEDSPESLANTLRPLLAASPGERRALGEKGQKVLGERFSRKVIFDLWEELLQRAAKKKGRADTARPEQTEWNEAMLSQAALEICSRAHPFQPDEAAAPETAIARLRADLQSLGRDYQALERKYQALLARFQEVSNRRKRR